MPFRALLTELDFQMTLRRSLSALSFAFLLFCASFGAWASIPTSLGTQTVTGAFTVGNDTFTMSGCTSTNNSVACNNTGLEVVGSVARGVVTLTLECPSTTSCTDSSLVNRSSGTASLALTVTVTASSGYQPVSQVYTEVDGSNTGFGHTVQGVFSFATSGTNENFGGSLTDSIASGTSTAGTNSSAVNSTNSSGWSVTDTLSMNTAVGTGENITMAIITFYKTPEPASIAVLLCGLGGIAAARRRRRRSI